MKVGDLVRSELSVEVGIIVDWYVIYDRFGDAVDRMAVVNWDSCSSPEHEYPDMLEVINENR